MRRNCQFRPTALPAAHGRRRLSCDALLWRARLLAVACCLAAAWLPNPAAGGGEPWPDFRGPGGDGLSRAVGLPIEWSDQQGIVWKTPVPGRGWSSPVVWQDLAWLTTASEDGHQLWAVAVDVGTGQLRHHVLVFEVAEPAPIDVTNSYASPSPVIDEQRVYVHFGTYGTACLATDSGRILWKRRDFPVDHQKGPGSSPVLAGPLLIFQCDGNDVQYLVALDKLSGQTVWRTERSADLAGRDPDYRKSFSTPLLVQAAGRLQLVSTAAGAVYGYDPRDGRELWRVRYAGHTNVARPVSDGQLVYINTGYPRPELWAVKLDGVGDVTDTHVLWRVTRGVPIKTSPLLLEGRLYLVSDTGGVLSCLDAATGQTLATRRLGGNYAASPLHAQERIYVCSDGGRTSVLAADPRLELLAENPLEEGCLASPAVAGQGLLLRTTGHLLRIEARSQ